MEISEYEIQFGKTKIGVLVVPLAASDTQFLLTTEIGEIMSMGYVRLEDDSVQWKFGKPNEEAIGEIERQLVALFGWEV